MPEWLEAIRTEVPDHQLKEFREVLRYILHQCVYSGVCIRFNISPATNGPDLYVVTEDTV